MPVSWRLQDYEGNGYCDYDGYGFPEFDGGAMSGGVRRVRSVRPVRRVGRGIVGGENFFKCMKNKYLLPPNATLLPDGSLALDESGKPILKNIFKEFVKKEKALCSGRKMTEAEIKARRKVLRADKSRTVYSRNRKINMKDMRAFLKSVGQRGYSKLKSAQLTKLYNEVMKTQIG